MTQRKEQPIPQGKYLPAVRQNDIVYTSGMTPRKAGKLIYSGKIKADEPIENYRNAIQLATSNALTAAQSCLRDGERISVVLRLNVYLNTEKEYTAHARIADYASHFLIENLGAHSIGSRAAIGVETLPSNAPVEISMVATIE